MTGNPFSGLGRVGWMEFWSHLKSPRLIVLVALFALLVFGASYGLSQTPSFGPSNSAFLAGHPAIRNESGVNHYFVVAWDGDIRGTPQGGKTFSVYAANLTPFGPQDRQLLANLTTNATGWISLDVTASYSENTTFVIESASSSQGQPFGMEMSYVFFDPTLLNRTFSASGVGTSYSSGPMGTESLFYTHVTTIEGFPATAADVYLNDTLVGHPDENGFVSASLPPGPHTIRIAFGAYEETYPVSGQPDYGPVYQTGADYVLLTLTSFLSLLLPIAAIAVSFDAVARERAQGSLEVLLARKVRREGIATGKFLGAFAAVALPVSAVLLAGVGILTWASGKSPTGSLVGAVIVGSLFLVAVYVLIMLIFSTVAKSVGTAVIFGVVVWFFFNVIFSFLTVFIMFSSGGSFFDPATYRLLVTVQLFDPNTVYQMLVSLAVPSTGGTGGLVPTGYITASSVVVAAVAWVVVLLVVALVVFRKRAES